MLPDRVIANQSSKKCWHKKTSAFFHELYNFSNTVGMHRIINVLLPFLISIQWTIGLCKLIFNWAPLIFYPIWTTSFHMLWALFCCAHYKRPVFWKLAARGLGISNMNFLIADVISESLLYLVQMITFSQRGSANVKSKQFSEFGSRTNRPRTHWKTKNCWDKGRSKLELRRLRSDPLNPKFGSQKSALLWLKSRNFSET